MKKVDKRTPFNKHVAAGKNLKINKRTPTFIPESKVCLLSISDLADLAVYGVLSAIEGCDAFQDILNNTKVAKWYNRMKQACALKEGQSIFNGQDPVMEWHDCK